MSEDDASSSTIKDDDNNASRGNASTYSSTSTLSDDDSRKRELPPSSSSQPAKRGRGGQQSLPPFRHLPGSAVASSSSTTSSLSPTIHQLVQGIVDPELHELISSLSKAALNAVLVTLGIFPIPELIDLCSVIKDAAETSRYDTSTSVLDFVRKVNHKSSFSGIQEEGHSLSDPFFPANRSWTRDEVEFRRLQMFGCSRIDRILNVDFSFEEFEVWAPDCLQTRPAGRSAAKFNGSSLESIQAAFPNARSDLSHNFMAFLPLPQQKIARFSFGDNINSFLARLSLDGHVRADRFDSPYELVSAMQRAIPFEDRTASLLQFFNFAEQRVEKTEFGKVNPGKVYTPLVVIYAGPGMGKSRFLDEIAHPTTRAQHLASLISQMPELPPELQTTISDEVQIAIKDAIAVSITFNSTMSRVGKHQANTTDDLSALALRLFYSHFVAQTMGFSSFMNHYMAQDAVFDLNYVIECILNDIDSHHPTGRKRHLFLFIDETYLGVDERKGDETIDLAFKGFLSALGASLESHPRVHMLLTSLYWAILKNSETDTGRSIKLVTLPPLKPESVRKIYEKDWTLSGTEQKPSQILQRFFLDAAGWPRLLEYSQMVVEKVKKKGRLESPFLMANLRTKLGEAPILKNFSRFAGEESCRKPFRKALVLALRGNPISVELHNECVATGFSLKKEAQSMYIPEISLSIIDFLNIKKYPPDTVIVKLLQLCNLFLDYDFHPYDFHGRLFEQQFSCWFRIRCLALVASFQGEPIREGECVDTFKPLALMELLECEQLPPPAGIRQPTPRYIPLAMSAIKKHVLLIPAEITIITCENPNLNPGIFWFPGKPNFQCIDAIVSFNSKTMTDQVFHLGLQFKWSSIAETGKSKTPVSLNTIVTSIVNTCSHSFLHEPISTGRFCLVFFAFTEFQNPQNCPRWDDFIPILKANIAEYPSLKSPERDLACKLAENIYLLDKTAINQLLTPTLQDRPALSKTLSSAATSTSSSLPSSSSSSSSSSSYSIIQIQVLQQTPEGAECGGHAIANIAFKFNQRLEIVKTPWMRSQDIENQITRHQLDSCVFVIDNLRLLDAQDGFDMTTELWSSVLIRLRNREAIGLIINTASDDQVDNFDARAHWIAVYIPQNVFARENSIEVMDSLNNWEQFQMYTKTRLILR